MINIVKFSIVEFPLARSFFNSQIEYPYGLSAIHLRICGWTQIKRIIVEKLIGPNQYGRKDLCRAIFFYASVPCQDVKRF